MIIKTEYLVESGPQFWSTISKLQTVNGKQQIAYLRPKGEWSTFRPFHVNELGDADRVFSALSDAVDFAIEGYHRAYDAELAELQQRRDLAISKLVGSL